MPDSTAPLSTPLPPIPTQPPKLRTANSRQIGGHHYKDLALQPWDACVAWQLGFLDGNALKYIARHRTEGGGGVEDLKKAIHYLEKMVENYGAITR